MGVRASGVSGVLCGVFGAAVLVGSFAAPAGAQSISFGPSVGVGHSPGAPFFWGIGYPTAGTVRGVYVDVEQPVWKFLSVVGAGTALGMPDSVCRDCFAFLDAVYGHVDGGNASRSPPGFVTGVGSGVSRAYGGVGPRVSYGDEVRVFGHVLFGRLRTRGAWTCIYDTGVPLELLPPVDVCPSKPARARWRYAESYGGGVDVAISESWGVRGAFDYDGETRVNVGVTWTHR